MDNVLDGRHGEEGRNSPSSPVCYLGDIQHEQIGASETKEEARTVHGKGLTSDVHVATSASGNKSDSTPRSGAPSMAGTPAAYSDNVQVSSASETGYFSPKPLRYHSTYLPRSAAPSTEPSPTQSANASTTSVNWQNGSSTPLELPRTPLEYLERPVVQRDISNISTASSTTVKASDYGLRSSQRPLPDFPNQAYAALHSQHYPPPYSPHILRTRSSHPSHHSSSSIAGGLPLGHTHGHFHGESGSKTVGNSPASSPGLFTPKASPIRPAFGSSEEQGAYSSPYLHYTHRQLPKETHIADVDVDPISGRKLVNQYEIIDELGRGVHGKVKLGRNLIDGQHVAIKIVDRYSKKRRLGKSGSHEDKIKKEIAILKKARHPNIVSLLEVIDDPAKKKVYIVLEFVEMGEVTWRTEAPKDIALIEYRRYQRESRGVFDDQAAMLEDKRILRRAQRRREKKDRKLFRELQRQRSEGPVTESWSFEHGGDADDEDIDFEQASRVSTTTTDTTPSESGSSRQATIALRSSSSLDNNDESVPADDDPGEVTPSLDPGETTLPPSEEDLLPPSATDLEGTMYGAYVSLTPRGRTPSVAASLASHRTEDESWEIPEHFRYVPLMTLAAVRAAIRDTVLGLEYLHYQGVIHRDIKPANLLQTKDHRIKISDFGVSYLGRQSEDGAVEDQPESDFQGADEDEAIELAKTVGTPAFYAPELCQIDCDTDTPPVTGQIDVWALGVTLYCLVFGRVPFHDLNTFVLMRMIADDDVYIPRTRLKAVDTHSGSRPSSHGRLFQPVNSSKRAVHELTYEEVDEDLYDLLKRLLIKDPKRRIKLTEVKHHPWLLRDIADPVAWLEETDTFRQTQGKKIEVSKEDLAFAVVSLNFVERAKSALRKLGGNIGQALGIGKAGTSRKRAKSSTTNVDPPSSSMASSSSTLNQDARKTNLKIDESIFSAIKASREAEHLPSKSVTASPELRDHPQYFDSSSSRPTSPMVLAKIQENKESPVLPRPALTERAQSSVSTAGSIRTIRQTDIGKVAGDPSPVLPPGLPGTPLAVEAPGASSLGGIFGGAGRRIMKSVRTQERNTGDPGGHERAKSIDRVFHGCDDPHAEPSIAFSPASAAGHVDPPDSLKEDSPSAPSFSSPGPSRTASIASPDMLKPHLVERNRSRQSSLSSPSSSRPHTAISQEHMAPAHYSASHMEETADERFHRAKDEMMRRRLKEEEQARSRPSSAAFQRPTSALSQAACPPSPDDEIFYQKQKEEAASRPNVTHELPSLETSPTTNPSNIHPLSLTASSSEDQFTGLSQSTSNPSIPSVISADSSVLSDEALTVEYQKGSSTQSSDGTVEPSETSNAQDEDDSYARGRRVENNSSDVGDVGDDSEGYVGDHAIESDDDDGDDSDEDFIEMTRHKPHAQGLPRSGSISNAQLARRRIRRETGTASIKTARSGSNSTMKKVRSHNDSSDEDSRRKPLEPT